MPIRDFQCRKCEQEFEAIIKSGDNTDCPTCGSSELKQLVSNIAGHYWRTKHPPEGAKRSEIHREEAKKKKHERQKQHWRDDFGDGDYK
jgi:putative FmdB family regulatory protein